MAAKEVSVHVYISGRVQGVFYRAWTKQNAEKLGVTGWARNLDDGRVEAVFEGDASSVKKMVDMCNKGPAFSKVEGVEVAIKKVMEGLDGFKVIF